MKLLKYLCAAAVATAAVPMIIHAADNPPDLSPILLDADHQPVRPNTPPDITLLCVYRDGTGDITYELWIGPPAILDDNDSSPLYSSILSAQITDSSIRAQIVSNDDSAVKEIDINRFSGHFTKVYRSLKDSSQYVKLDGSCQQAKRKF